ncbi:hypothetical protein HMPREF9080_02014 [Cardiobacterium valvarum F0432]|uniref:Uncharacterized protein n=1 Tax=Cardiobacterium valvarum F0432 TaxID=797473 RepID=G9ZGQ0_9GAMM|nr:hypothetical protein HMPREF9080_02014 [Cardiobacterium valvarum F0432]
MGSLCGLLLRCWMSDVGRSLFGLTVARYQLQWLIKGLTSTS